METELRQAVLDAMRRAEVREGVEAVYADLAREIEARKPVCSMSGLCCRFEEYGHRLYVTTIELAAFMHGLAAGKAGSARIREAIETWEGRGCPLQLGKICGVHGIRPFGCRVFFCDPNATEWQNEQYERFHARIKRLHEELGVPYFYVEWRAGLRAIGLERIATCAAASRTTGTRNGEQLT